MIMVILNSKIKCVKFEIHNETALTHSYIKLFQYKEFMGVYITALLQHRMPGELKSKYRQSTACTTKRWVVSTCLTKIWSSMILT